MMRRWQRQGGAWDERWFVWVVFLCPLLLQMDSWVLRGLGVVALAAVLVRGWGTARRDPGMLAFLLFAEVVTTVDEYGGRALREVAVPYTGWVATAPYSFCIFFAVVALWSGSSPFRRGVAALLALQVIFGVVEWLGRWPYASENPYLRVELWRPVWTVAIPLLWTGILLVGERSRQREGAPTLQRLTGTVESDAARR